MNLTISNPRFSNTEMGGFFKESKIQYTWEFVLDNMNRKVELQHSRLKGKRIIFLDGKEILKSNKFTYEFSYSFTIDKHFLSLIQLSATNYDLRIDNIAFNTIIEYCRKNYDISEKTEKKSKTSNKMKEPEFWQR